MQKNSLVIATRKLSQLIALFYATAAAAAFTNSNWLSLRGFPGANGQISAAVFDSDGNVYSGGSVRMVGNVLAKNIAKWDGTRGSAIGTGNNGRGDVLAVRGKRV